MPTASLGRLAIALLAPVLLPMCVFAAEPGEPQWYLGVQGSHVQPDSERQVRNAAGGGLLFGLPLGGGFNAELNAFGLSFHGRDHAPDLPAWGGGIDLSYVPGLGNGRVFALAGGGWNSGYYAMPTGFSEDERPLYGREKDDHAYVRAGIGFYAPGMRSRLSDAPAYFRSHWLLRADLSWYGALDARTADGERRFDDVRLNVGIVFVRTAPARRIPLYSEPLPEVVPDGDPAEAREER